MDSRALAEARADVDRLTHAKSFKPTSSNNTDIVGPLPLSSALLGSTLPSASERQLAREAAEDERRWDRKAKLKEGYNRADELVPKSGGREGILEEKKATNAENRQFREKDMAAGLEADEGILMGDNNGFAAA